jgi:two-component system LytT family sensor kinase
VIYLVACAFSMGVVGVFAFCGPLPPFIEAKSIVYTDGTSVPNPRDLAFFILARITTQLPVFWGLVAVAHAVRFYERDHLRKLRETELRTQLAEARLQALQLQLNPHFLFNTLNSIAALVNENPATAEKMIVALGDLLRMTLATSDRKLVSIREELHLLDQYLLIERIRFGGRLKVETQIDEALLDDLVPVFILQPLAENAVKHGVENQLSPALIRVTAKSAGAGDLLLLEITNDGPASDIPLQTIKERIGLSNTRSRLQAMFGSQASLKLLPGNHGGFTVRLMIPRQSAAARPSRLEPQTVL